MPNYCENELTISGPDVERVLAAMRDLESDDPDEHIFDFDKIIPYPQEFKDIDIRSAEYQTKLHAIAKDDPERESRLKALAAEYDTEPGALWLKDGYNSGGYEWTCSFWGTKWNAIRVCLTKRPANAPPAETATCEHCRIPHKTAGMRVLVCQKCGAPLPDTRPIVALVEFETAWSPPVPVVEKLMEMFPDHEFELEYYEGGVGFCGQARWTGGQEQYHNISDYAGSRGG
jgi:hypothetical protein